MATQDEPNSVEYVDTVMEWRQWRLERAGFDPTEALRLASDRTVDIYLAVKLVHCGCPHSTAARIVT